VCVLAGLAGAAATALAGPLIPYQASYNIVWKGMTAGVATMTLANPGGAQWVYDSVTEPRGLFRAFTDALKQHSEMELTADGIRPLRYVGEDGSASANRDINLTFDWQRLHVSGTAAGEAVDAAVAPGTQDDLSVQIALTHALDNGATPASFSTYGDSGARDYKYTREGTESLTTPIGALETIIYRAQRQGSPRSTRYWCAPSLGYLPLRAQQRRNDEVEWTMEIRALKR
jgi:hypothetical protein